MVDDLIKATDKVNYLLKKYPKTRDSDKILWLAYLVIFRGLKEKMGDEAYRVFQQILIDKNTHTMESITRARRKAQEAGMFVGTRRAQRLDESENVRQWAIDN